jgi:hypothetical protein
VAETVEVIVRHDQGTWAAWSPQCPGLAIVQPTQSDLVDVLPGVLAEYVAAAGDAVPGVDVPGVRLHVEFEVQGVVVRVCQDEQLWERQHVGERLATAIGGDRRAEFADAPANPLGDVVFVCALPTDTLGWALRQMEIPADTLNIVTPVADNLIWISPFRREDYDADITDVGLPLAESIAEVMQLDAAPIRVAA